MQKPLSVVTAAMPGLSERDVLVVDDHADTLIYNAANGVVIPAYDPISLIGMGETGDSCLYELMSWIARSGVLRAPDVRTVPKVGIFE